MGLLFPALPGKFQVVLLCQALVPPVNLVPGYFELSGRCCKENFFRGENLDNRRCLCYSHYLRICLQEKEDAHEII